MRKQIILFKLFLVVALISGACTAKPAVSDNSEENRPIPLVQPTVELNGEQITPLVEEIATLQPQEQENDTDREVEQTITPQDLPAWFKVELTNVANDETFTFQSLLGKVMLVETMAQWCSNCLRQQQEVKALHQLLGERDDFVSIGLDIDPNEDAETLKNYVTRHQFDWVYAISPAEVSRSLSDLYGAQFLSPPATPMLIIDRQGQVHLLPMGIKSAERLNEFLQPFLETDG